MNRKHIVLFYDGDNLIETTPRNWARNNQSYFSNYTFENSDSTPVSEAVNIVLVNQLGFVRIENNVKVICFKLL
jgi:hypothetical protein